jgi:hypothetical protein
MWIVPLLLLTHAKICRASALMGVSAKVTTNAPAIPDARVMMFLLLRSSASDEEGTRPLLAVRANTRRDGRQMAHAHTCA